MSYANLILYGAVLPSYNSKGEKTAGKPHETINADDPKNRDKVREFLNSIKD